MYGSYTSSWREKSFLLQSCEDKQTENAPTMCANSIQSDCLKYLGENPIVAMITSTVLFFTLCRSSETKIGQALGCTVEQSAAFAAKAKAIHGNVNTWSTATVTNVRNTLCKSALSLQEVTVVAIYILLYNKIPQTIIIKDI